MAISTSVNIDGVAGTATTSLYQNGSTLIDTITYNNSAQTISFIVRNIVLTLSPQDFLAKLDYFTQFNNILINSAFSPSQTQYIPFLKMNVDMENDGISQLTWIVKPYTHQLFNFTCTYPSGSVVLEKRTHASTISYAQWIYLSHFISHFSEYVRNAFKL